VAGTVFTFAELRGLFVSAGGPQEWADTMAAIAIAESGGCRFALAGPTDIRPVKSCAYRHTTSENSIGLWQINAMAHPQYDTQALFNATYNAGAAVAVLGHGSPTPWSTYTNGAYKSYLPGTGLTGLPVGGAERPFPRDVQTGPTGSVGTPNTLPIAWAHFTKAMAITIPTQMRRARVASRSYKRKVRGIGSRPPGLRGPVKPKR